MRFFLFSTEANSFILNENVLMIPPFEGMRCVMVPDSVSPMANTGKYAERDDAHSFEGS
jgi:hypothetical protein